MSQLPHPSGPDEVTPEWLTSVLRENHVIASEIVTSVSIEIIGQEWGFTGVIARVQLQYREDKSTALSSVVIKFPMATRDIPSTYRMRQQRDIVAAQHYFERCTREVLFYQQVAPINHLPAPRPYYGAADSATGCVILVLEDLHGARVGDVLSGCSKQEAALVVEQLARFHAQWWNSPLLDTFTWLPQWGGDPMAAQHRYSQLIEPFLQRFGQHIPQPARGLIDALATSYGVMRSRLQHAPATMIHGDLHLDNVLFHGLEHEPAITVIDWQSVSKGRGVIDLASFLFESFQSSILSDLLRRYHEILVASGVTGYSRSRFMEDCQLALLWLLGAKIVWLGSTDIEHLRGRELAIVEAASKFDKLFTAIRDYDAGSLLPL